MVAMRLVYGEHLLTKNGNIYSKDALMLPDYLALEKFIVWKESYYFQMDG